jgi:hypothetical protein
MTEILIASQPSSDWNLNGQDLRKQTSESENETVSQRS